MFTKYSADCYINNLILDKSSSFTRILKKQKRKKALFVSITRKLHANEFFLLLSAFEGPSSPLFWVFRWADMIKNEYYEIYNFLFLILNLKICYKVKKRFKILNWLHLYRFYCFLLNVSIPWILIMQWKVNLPFMLKKEDILWPLK